jgi:hypothetical protein
MCRCKKHNARRTNYLAYNSSEENIDKQSTQLEINTAPTINCTRITGIENLIGSTILNKIEKLFNECAISLSYIYIIEIISSNCVQLYFKNRFINANIKHILERYIKNNYCKVNIVIIRNTYI